MCRRALRRGASTSLPPGDRREACRAATLQAPTPSCHTVYVRLFVWRLERWSSGCGGSQRSVPIRAAGRAEVEAALVELRRVRAWVDASEASLARTLAMQASFPEQAIAETSRGSLGSAGKTLDRSKTLVGVLSFAEALDDGVVTAGHVDAVTRAGKGLEVGRRAELFDRVASLVDVAAHASVVEFGRRVRDEARRIQADDGIDRLEGQRRATSKNLGLTIAAGASITAALVGALLYVALLELSVSPVRRTLGSRDLDLHDPDAVAPLRLGTPQVRHPEAVVRVDRRRSTLPDRRGVSSDAVAGTWCARRAASPVWPRPDRRSPTPPRPSRHTGWPRCSPSVHVRRRS